MKPLLPHEQRVILREINRVRDEKNADSGLPREGQRISKDDIRELSESFAAILAEEVIVE